MFQVSDEYKQAISQETREDKIEGTITLKNGTVINFTDEDILGDTIKIDNQSVSGEGLDFGSVYAGQLSMSILSDIDRYSLFDAVIKISHYLLVDEIYYEVPLGIFTVDSATRVGTVIQLTALDRMTKLDVPLESNANGTWYDMLLFIADNCDIQLSQTQEEIEALHKNVPVYIYHFSTENIGTYRDALALMCSCICAFASFDRYGCLKICKYSAETDAENDPSTRLLDCKFSDYETIYAGAKCRFLENGEYKEYSSTRADIPDGLILNLGDLPIVGGFPDEKQLIIDNIVDSLITIPYVPTTLNMPPNPCYELGDKIICNEINSTQDSIVTYVMKYSYNYRKTETLTCVGANPRMQNVSDQSDKQQQSYESQLTTKDIVVNLYTNISEYEINQDEKSIIEFNYSAFKDCNPIFIATIPFVLNVDGYVEFTFYESLIKIDDATYTQYYQAGHNFATISFGDTIGENERKSLRIHCRAYRNEESKIRKQDAKIGTIYNFIDAVKNQNKSIVDTLAIETSLPITSLSNELVYEEVLEDTTEPTMVIEREQIHAMLYAQGLSRGEEWDGNLEFTESMEGVPIGGDITAQKFSSQFVVSEMVPEPASFTESIPGVSIGTITVGGFGATVEENTIIV